MLLTLGAGGRTKQAWSKAAPTIKQKLALAEYKVSSSYTLSALIELHKTHPARQSSRCSTHN
jgi:hypothetical protein